MTTTGIGFSARDREFIHAVARGLPIPDAAEALGISLRSAQHAAERVRLKLNVKSLRDVPLAYWRATGENPFPSTPEVSQPQTTEEEEGHHGDSGASNTE